MIIHVCMGSSCYLKGSFEIIQKLEELQKDGYNLNVFGKLCFDSCSDGVCVKIDSELISGVNSNNIEKIIKDRYKEQ